jgi:UDP-N-acetylglucosamine 2-epimerase (non-hydrolysing)
MKQIMTITGIRPDFIRMSEVFKRLDQRFQHILVCSGQHYDKMLADVFFEDLNLRRPDYNLGIGGPNKKHYHQMADLSVKIIDLIQNEKLHPEMILFLGDSNSVCCAVPLKKEGFVIGHIEAGMRSYDRRMLEEINRVVCDHCSDRLFVYHEDYRAQLLRENIPSSFISVVGNTIVEVCNKYKPEVCKGAKSRSYILMDIHRPENTRYPERMRHIFTLANWMSKTYSLPVHMLAGWHYDPRDPAYADCLGDIKIIPLMSYLDYLAYQYHAAFMISDSGTAQEEPALLGTPVVVPRDYTERPQSVMAYCSRTVNVNKDCDYSWEDALDWLGPRMTRPAIETGWLGDGKTADRIVHQLASEFN